MKRNTLLLTVIFLFLSFLCAQYAFAGAWTLPKYKVWGEWYQKFEYAKEEYNATWKRQQMTREPAGNNGRNWGFTMEPKLEFGITDWWTFMTSLQYKEYHYKEYGRPAAWGPYSRKNHGLTYVMVGSRIRLIDKPVIVSVQAREFMYVGGYGIDHRDDPFFNQNQPGVGWGNDSFDLRGIVSKKWDVKMPIDMPWYQGEYKLPMYASAESGYVFNNRHVCNAWVYFTEYGIWPVPWLLLKTELDGIKTHDGTGSVNEQAYGIWRIGARWHIFEGDAYLRQGTKAFDIEFQYGMYLWGKNCAAYNEFVLKVDTQF